MGEAGCLEAVLDLVQQHVASEACREAACWALKNLVSECGKSSAPAVSAAHALLFLPSPLSEPSGAASASPL